MVRPGSRELGELGDLAPGEPRLARARADELTDWARALAEASETTAAARAVSVQGWHGAAAEAFVDGVAEVEPSVEALVRRAGAGAEVLQRWAGELAQLQDAAEDLVRRYRAARDAAAAALDSAAAAEGAAVLRTSSSDAALATASTGAQARAAHHDAEAEELVQQARRLQHRHGVLAAGAAAELHGAAGTPVAVAVAADALLAVVRDLVEVSAQAAAGLASPLLAAVGTLVAHGADGPALRAVVGAGPTGPTTVVLVLRGAAPALAARTAVLVDGWPGDPRVATAGLRVGPVS